MISFICLVVIVLMVIGIINDVGVFGAILCGIGIFLFFAFIGFLIQKGEENRKKKNPTAWEQEQQKKEQAIARKYHYYAYTCPMCRSNKVRDLSFDERTDPIKSVSRVGKNYHCDNCEYIW